MPKPEIAKTTKITQILCDKMEILTSSSPKNFQNLREITVLINLEVLQDLEDIQQTKMVKNSKIAWTKNNEKEEIIQKKAKESLILKISLFSFFLTNVFMTSEDNMSKMYHSSIFLCTFFVKF